MATNTADDLEIIAFDKGFASRRPVPAVRHAEFDLVTNGLSSGTFELDADDPANVALQRFGARIVLNYRGRQELSGPVRKQKLGLRTTDRQVYTVEDDWRVLQNTLAWVVPTAGYFSQGRLDAQALTDDAQAISTVAHDPGTNAGYGAFVFPTTNGSISAETAIKTLVSRNLVDRLGPAWQAARGTATVPFRIAPDQQRGGDAGLGTKLPAPRFETLADNLAALLAWSGLNLTVAQHPTDPVLVVDVAPSTTYPNLITLDSGILVDGDGSISGPNATRIVVGGPGDVTARDFHEVLDGTSLESLYGDVIEVLKDAGSAPMPWPSSLASALQVPKYYRLRPEVAAADKATYLAALNATGADGLTEGLPRSGIGVTLAETETFFYGGAARSGYIGRGTNLNVQLAATPTGGTTASIVTKVTGAHIVLDAEAGISSTVTVGERTDDPDLELARALAGVQTALRRRASRR